MLALALLLVQQAGPLPPYAESIRCAALAEAAHRLDKEGPEAARHYDAALFWGLAASERARNDGIAAPQFTADQERARGLALPDLAGGQPKPMQELLDCLARVPATRS